MCIEIIHILVLFFLISYSHTLSTISSSRSICRVRYLRWHQARYVLNSVMIIPHIYLLASPLSHGARIACQGSMSQIFNRLTGGSSFVCIRTIGRYVNSSNVYTPKSVYQYDKVGPHVESSQADTRAASLSLSRLSLHEPTNHHKMTSLGLCPVWPGLRTPEMWIVWSVTVWAIDL